MNFKKLWKKTLEHSGTFQEHKSLPFSFHPHSTTNFTWSNPITTRLISTLPSLWQSVLSKHIIYLSNSQDLSKSHFLLISAVYEMQQNLR